MEPATARHHLGKADHPPPRRAWVNTVLRLADAYQSCPKYWPLMMKPVDAVTWASFCPLVSVGLPKSRFGTSAFERSCWIFPAMNDLPPSKALSCSPPGRSLD